MRTEARRRRSSAGVFVMAMLIAACEAGGAAPPNSRQSPCDSNAGDSRYTRVHVERVIDGDTIVVTASGREERVRYIGVNAPESVKPDSPVEHFGPEASEYNRRLIAGRDICLEQDVSDTDRFGRWLRYVYLGDMFVNERIVRDGYARATTFPPDVKHQAVLQAAESEARQAGRGLWQQP